MCRVLFPTSSSSEHLPPSQAPLRVSIPRARRPRQRHPFAEVSSSEGRSGLAERGAISPCGQGHEIETIFDGVLIPDLMIPAINPGLTRLKNTRTGNGDLSTLLQPYGSSRTLNPGRHHRDDQDFDLVRLREDEWESGAAPRQCRRLRVPRQRSGPAPAISAETDLQA